MGVQQALLFIAAVRRDASLRGGLAARADEIALQDFVAAGASHGRSFNVSELRQAFRHEWALRALRSRARSG